MSDSALECDSCGKHAAFIRCPCRQVVYCDRVCQRNHWRSHREHCNASGRTRLVASKYIPGPSRKGVNDSYDDLFIKGSQTQLLNRGAVRRRQSQTVGGVDQGKITNASLKPSVKYTGVQSSPDETQRSSEVEQRSADGQILGHRSPLTRSSQPNDSQCLDLEVPQLDETSCLATSTSTESTVKIVPQKVGIDANYRFRYNSAVTKELPNIWAPLFNPKSHQPTLPIPWRGSELVPRPPVSKPAHTKAIPATYRPGAALLDSGSTLKERMSGDTVCPADKPVAALLASQSGSQHMNPKTSSELNSSNGAIQTDREDRYMETTCLAISTTAQSRRAITPDQSVIREEGTYTRVNENQRSAPHGYFRPFNPAETYESRVYNGYGILEASDGVIIAQAVPAGRKVHTGKVGSLGCFSSDRYAEPEPLRDVEACYVDDKPVPSSSPHPTTNMESAFADTINTTSIEGEVPADGPFCEDEWLAPTSSRPVLREDVSAARPGKPISEETEAKDTTDWTIENPMFRAQKAVSSTGREILQLHYTNPHNLLQPNRNQTVPYDDASSAVTEVTLTATNSTANLSDAALGRSAKMVESRGKKNRRDVGEVVSEAIRDTTDDEQMIANVPHDDAQQGLDEKVEVGTAAPVSHTHRSAGEAVQNSAEQVGNVAGSDTEINLSTAKRNRPIPTAGPRTRIESPNNGTEATMSDVGVVQTVSMRETNQPSPATSWVVGSDVGTEGVRAGARDGAFKKEDRLPSCEGGNIPIAGTLGDTDDMVENSNTQSPISVSSEHNATTAQPVEDPPSATSYDTVDFFSSPINNSPLERSSPIDGSPMEQNLLAAEQGEDILHHFIYTIQHPADDVCASPAKVSSLESNPTNPQHVACKGGIPQVEDPVSKPTGVYPTPPATEPKSSSIRSGQFRARRKSSSFELSDNEEKEVIDKASKSSDHPLSKANEVTYLMTAVDGGYVLKAVKTLPEDCVIMGQLYRTKQCDAMSNETKNAPHVWKLEGGTELGCEKIPESVQTPAVDCTPAISVGVSTSATGRISLASRDETEPVIPAESVETDANSKTVSDSSKGIRDIAGSEAQMSCALPGTKATPLSSEGREPTPSAISCNRSSVHDTVKLPGKSQETDMATHASVGREVQTEPEVHVATTTDGNDSSSKVAVSKVVDKDPEGVSVAHTPTDRPVIKDTAGTEERILPGPSVGAIEPSEVSKNGLEMIQIGDVPSHRSVKDDSVLRHEVPTPQLPLPDSGDTNNWLPVAIRCIKPQATVSIDTRRRVPIVYNPPRHIKSAAVLESQHTKHDIPSMKRTVGQALLDDENCYQLHRGCDRMFDSIEKRDQYLHTGTGHFPFECAVLKCRQGYATAAEVNTHYDTEHTQLIKRQKLARQAEARARAQSITAHEHSEWERVKQRAQRAQERQSTTAHEHSEREGVKQRVHQGLEQAGREKPWKREGHVPRQRDGKVRKAPRGEAVQKVRRHREWKFRSKHPPRETKRGVRDEMAFHGALRKLARGGTMEVSTATARAGLSPIQQKSKASDRTRSARPATSFGHARATTGVRRPRITREDSGTDVEYTNAARG